MRHWFFRRGLIKAADNWQVNRMDSWGLNTVAGIAAIKGVFTKVFVVFFEKSYEMQKDALLVSKIGGYSSGN